jgi:antitoxin component HigA of HigAB toxin-antitoxin module
MQPARITTEDEYRAALERIAELGEAASDSEELAALVAETSAWEAKAHRSESWPPPEGITSPDDLPFSGLPGNLGKLKKD